MNIYKAWTKYPLEAIVSSKWLASKRIFNLTHKAALFCRTRSPYICICRSTQCIRRTNAIRRRKQVISVKKSQAKISESFCVINFQWKMAWPLRYVKREHKPEKKNIHADKCFNVVARWRFRILIYNNTLRNLLARFICPNIQQKRSNTHKRKTNNRIAIGYLCVHL